MNEKKNDNQEEQQDPKANQGSDQETVETTEKNKPVAEDSNEKSEVADKEVNKEASASEESPQKTDAKVSQDNQGAADKKDHVGKDKVEVNDQEKRKPRRGGRERKMGKSQQRDEQVTPEFMEKVISIKRITKVTKGGKKLSFSALVVVGDMKGNVGYSLSKASEVAIAIRKAMAVAKKSMVPIPMRGSTITHEIIGECSGAEVLLKPASEGTGVIAAGPVRAVCDGAGIHNILTKCHRSNNPINVVKATLDGLTRLKRVEAQKDN